MASTPDLTGQIVKTKPHCYAVGGFSDIYEGDWTNPDTCEIVQVAIKVLRGVHTNPTVLAMITRRLNREARVWHSLSHRNIVQLLGLCRDVGSSTAMISHLYHNGDIYQYLANNPKADRLAIIIGIAHGLQYLHLHDVVHGDVKGNNVLIDDDGAPLLSDFGRSRLIEHKGFTTAAVAGSVRQMAPELLDPDDNVVVKVTKEGDVYAFSMVVLESCWRCCVANGLKNQTTRRLPSQTTCGDSWFVVGTKTQRKGWTWGLSWSA